LKEKSRKAQLATTKPALKQGGLFGFYEAPHALLPKRTRFRSTAQQFRETFGAASILTCKLGLWWDIVQNKEFQKLLLDRLENLEALLNLQIEHMERMREERNNAKVRCRHAEERCKELEDTLASISATISSPLHHCVPTKFR
jgi:hypothetical protein